MLSVPVLVHNLAGLPPPLPISDLKAFYGAFDIRLEVKPAAETIDGHPSDEADYQAVIQKILEKLPKQPRPGDPCHLIVGRTWIGPGEENVNGMLLDTGRRGFAAVFTQSADLYEGSQSRLLQAIVHELGHVLNLIHSDAQPAVPTAMCQARVRNAMSTPERIATAWNTAEINQPTENACFPFGRIERVRLESSNLDEVRPWGTAFRGDPWDDSSDLRLPLSLRLHTERKRHVVGGQVALVVELHNESAKSVNVPAYLDPSLRTLQVAVTRPNGKSYVHCPRISICSDVRRRLRPGERVGFPLLIVDGVGGTVLPASGRYEFQVAAPFVCRRANPVEVEAVDAGPAVFGDPEFQRFVSDGAPRTRRRQWSRLVQLLSAGKRSRSPDLSYLALLGAKQTSRLEVAKGFLDLAERRFAPRAVRHAAVRHRAVRMTWNPDAFDRLVKSASDRYTDTIIDQDLHRSLDTIRINYAERA